MENKKGAVSPIVIIGGVLVVAAIAVIAYYASTRSSTASQVPTSPAVNNETSVTEAPSASPYKDGTYNKIGEYVSPGGAEELDVTIVLKDGVVEDATVVSKATRPNSVRFHGEFLS